MRQGGYILPKSYRKIGFGFFILSILLLSSVTYLVWAKVIIKIIPDTEKIDQEYYFKVSKDSKAEILDGEITVPGKIKLINVQDSKSFTASGKRLVESDIIGEVTIINNYSKDQTLVETTRLASADDPDKVLVRLKKTVNVPAGQKVNVQVYPDDLENFSGLDKMKFIIPGLWGPLQDKIYAENSQALVAGGYQVSYLVQEDLDNAQAVLKDELYKKALEEINSDLSSDELLWSKLVSLKVVDFTSDTEVGQEAAEFSVTMNLEAAVVVFDEGQLISLIKSELKSLNPGERKLIDLDPNSFVYEVQNHNIETNQAEVKLSFKAESVINSGLDFFDKGKLVGKTAEEIESYFSQFPQVKSVEVIFKPAWLKKTPRLKDKIEIQIGE